jgi:hypothetical protein
MLPLEKSISDGVVTKYRIVQLDLIKVFPLIISFHNLTKKNGGNKRSGDRVVNDNKWCSNAKKLMVFSRNKLGRRYPLILVKKTIKQFLICEGPPIAAGERIPKKRGKSMLERMG